MIYFTSDTHFYHKKILDFENRPFNSVDEMTEKMIEIWNQQVKCDDIVYHLGDFILGSTSLIKETLSKLNGKIILIKGNHDYHRKYKKFYEQGLLFGYNEIGIRIKYNKHEMLLTHFPMEIGLSLNKWSIHGHIHSNESSYLNQINVGVDSPHFSHKEFGELVTIDELYDLILKRQKEIEKFLI